MDGQQFDSDAFMGRVSVLADRVRSSNAYPALIAGLAGAAAGAIMATLIASRVSRRALPRSVEKAVEQVAEKKSEKEKEAGQGWTAREIVQLATIGVTLLRQAQDWYAQRQQNKYTS